MRKVAFLAAFAAALVLGVGMAFAAPPDQMLINDIQKTKGPVQFNHKAHQGYAKDCKACHHADEVGKEQQCSKCHGLKTEGKKLNLKEAFHKQCKACHMKEKKGPAKCDDCHGKSK